MAQDNHWLRRRWVLMAVAIYVLAVAVRIVFILQVRHSPLYQCLTIDERTQNGAATAIVDGQIPQRAFVRAPAYTYFLATIYRIVGTDSLRARFAQVFVAGLCPVLLFLIGSRLFGPATGVLSGILGAVFWTFVHFSAEMLDATLCSALYLLLAYLLIALDDRRWFKWLASGLVMGVGVITRPNIMAFVPVLPVVAVLVTRDRILTRSSRATAGVWLRIGLRKAGLLVAGTALGIAPVAIRNRLVSDEGFLLSAWGPAAFWVANNPYATEKNMVMPPLDESVANLRLAFLDDPWVRTDGISKSLYLLATQELGHPPSFTEVKTFYTRLTKDYIRQHPGKLLTDMGLRFCHLFEAFEYPMNKDLYAFSENSSLLWTLSWLHFGVIGPIGVVGFVIALLRRPWPAGFTYYVAMFLSLALPSVLFQVTARYRLPLVYLLIPFVVYGTLELIRSLMRPIRWRRTSLMVGGLAGLMVFSNGNFLGYAPVDQKYLLLHFAGACIETGRHDLMVKTSDEVASVLADPARSEQIPPEAIRPFFVYFHERGDLKRAARFGREMMRRAVRTNDRTLGMLTDAFIRVDRPSEAAQALAALENVAHGSSNPYLALATLRYGRAYRDRAALTRAATLYTDLVRLHPDERKHRDGLSAARSALANLDTTPASKPAG